MFISAKLILSSSPLTFAEVRELVAEIPSDLESFHPDYLEISTNKATLGVEQIKQLVAWNSQKPFNAKVKVAVITQGELMTTEAQNALLKTLEEPAPETVIVIISKNELALLPTIRSRVSHVQTLNRSISNSKVEGSNSEKFSDIANDFINADYIGRTKLVTKLLKEFPERAEQTEILVVMMRILRDKFKSAINSETKLQIQAQLDASLVAHQALQNNVLNRLTWESLAITMV